MHNCCEPNQSLRCEIHRRVSGTRNDAPTYPVVDSVSGDDKAGHGPLPRHLPPPIPRRVTNAFDLRRVPNKGEVPGAWRKEEEAPARLAESHAKCLVIESDIRRRGISWTVKMALHRGR